MSDSKFEAFAKHGDQNPMLRVHEDGRVECLVPPEEVVHVLMALSAQLAEARAVLREVEWRGENGCIVCGQEGHAPDCRLAKVLGGDR